MSREIHLAVQGMTCGHCQAAVERSLSAVAGVDEVTVDLAAGAARASVEARVAVEALIAAVQTAGYASHEVGQE